MGGGWGEARAYGQRAGRWHAMQCAAKLTKLEFGGSLVDLKKPFTFYSQSLPDR